MACAVVRASRLNDWKTKPIRLLRTAASCVGRHVRDVLAVDGHDPGRRMVEQPDDVHQRRLARARRPHDREHLAAADLEGHAAERIDHDVVEDVALRDVARLKHDVTGSTASGACGSASVGT